MIDLLRSRFAFQLSYIKELVADIPESRFAEQPAPGMNSPAWLLGHLCWAAEFVPTMLGRTPTLDDAWTERFGAWSRPSTDATLYPPKGELIAALVAAHARVEEALPLATAERLAAELPDPVFRKQLPTIGDGVVHIMTTHEAVHAGQLSAWRRIVGLPPAEISFFA